MYENVIKELEKSVCAGLRDRDVPDLLWPVILSNVTERVRMQISARVVHERLRVVHERLEEELLRKH